MSPTEAPQDTRALYVELDEKDVHFLEMILTAYDGVAHLRRDWHMREGRRFFKILVPPDFLDEVERILEQVRKHVKIGEIRTSI
jgi:hypothetical protein